jgi:hypothetical protein
VTQIVRNRTLADRVTRTTPHREARDAAGLGGIVAGLPMLRTSERSTFKRCHWKWWWEFEEVLKPKTDVPPLRFGSLIHKALADFYIPGVKRGPHPAARFRYHYDQELRLQESFGFKVPDVEDDEVWREAGELGEAMLDNYVDRYGADDEWEVLVTEQAFQQVVPKPWSIDPNHPASAQTLEPWFIYVGILDGIWRNRRTKKISIVDHKTAKAINVMYLSLDSQATAYWTWGLDWIYEQGLLRPREKPAGMMYNHLRKAMPDPREYEIVNGKKVYLNLDGSYSKKQPAPYFVRTPIYRDWHEREAAREQVYAEFADIEMIQTGREDDKDGNLHAPPAGAYKNQGQFTCPGCWLFDVCELHEIGGDWKEMMAHTTREWEPYDAHHVYTDETH